MAVENLKSTSITNLDATPVVTPSAGEGGPGIMREVSGHQTVSASASVTSTYQLVRVPSNAIIKSLLFESQAQTAGKFQLGVYYSDSKVDGTAVANQGVVVDAKFFSDDIDCAAAVLPTEKIFGTGGSNTPDKRNKKLWDALALTSDPGGYFDIVATVHTTAVTTGTGMIWVSAHFIA